MSLVHERRSESQRTRSKREDTEGGGKPGLKLESQGGPAEFLVVDHVQHVNEN